MMYEVLCTHGGFGAWFLRVWMWCRWSHSAIYDYERGIVTHSTFWDGGVIETPAREFFAKYTKYELRKIYIEIGKLPAARAWLKAQVGKKYDWTALFGIALHRDWADPSSWFCSELSETLRTLFSKRRFRAAMKYITPKTQDMQA